MYTAGSINKGERVPALVIRKASADDLYAMADLEIRSAKYEQRLVPLQCTLQELHEIWYQRYYSGQYEILVAEIKFDDEAYVPRLAGFIAFVAPLRKNGFIQAMYVDPDFFRKGIGAHLFYAAEKILNQQHCPMVVLHVEPKNTSGQQFYAKLGFVNQMRRFRHLIVLAKRLKGSYAMAF